MYPITTHRPLRDQAMFLFDYDSLSGLLTNRIQEYKIQPKRLIFFHHRKSITKNFEGKSSRSIGGAPIYFVYSFCNWVHKRCIVGVVNFRENDTYSELKSFGVPEIKLFEERSKVPLENANHSEQKVSCKFINVTTVESVTEIFFGLFILMNFFKALTIWNLMIQNLIW